MLRFGWAKLMQNWTVCWTRDGVRLDRKVRITPARGRAPWKSIGLAGGAVYLIQSNIDLVGN